VRACVRACVCVCVCVCVRVCVCVCAMKGCDISMSTVCNEGRNSNVVATYGQRNAPTS
jgi:hypothetical protein